MKTCVLGPQEKTFRGLIRRRRVSPAPIEVRLGYKQVVQENWVATNLPHTDLAIASQSTPHKIPVGFVCRASTFHGVGLGPAAESAVKKMISPMGDGPPKDPTGRLWGASCGPKSAKDE